MSRTAVSSASLISRRAAAISASCANRPNGSPRTAPTPVCDWSTSRCVNCGVQGHSLTGFANKSLNWVAWRQRDAP